MKNILFLLSVGILSLFSCKKDTISPAFVEGAYEEIQQAKDQFSTDNIYVKATNPVNGLNDGAIIFYKTTKGFYGKMKIVSATVDPNSALTIDMVNYNNKGEVILSKKNIVLNLGIACDLDSGMTYENDIDDLCEFYWAHPSDQNFVIYIKTLDLVGFYVYSN